MLNIKDCSVMALRIAIRWARLNNYPASVADITEAQSKKLQIVADEFDRRNHAKNATHSNY